MTSALARLAATGDSRPRFAHLSATTSATTPSCRYEVGILAINVRTSDVVGFPLEPVSDRGAYLAWTAMASISKSILGPANRCTGISVLTGG